MITIIVKAVSRGALVVLRSKIVRVLCRRIISCYHCVVWVVVVGPLPIVAVSHVAALRIVSLLGVHVLIGLVLNVTVRYHGILTDHPSLHWVLVHSLVVVWLLLVVVVLVGFFADGGFSFKVRVEIFVFFFVCHIVVSRVYRFRLF